MFEAFIPHSSNFYLESELLPRKRREDNVTGVKGIELYAKEVRNEETLKKKMKENTYYITNLGKQRMTEVLI